MSVYRVIDIIGTSPSSWENAAAEAIHRVKQTIDDIRVAQVVEQDIAVGDNGEVIYRTKLRVSFKIRPPKSSGSSGGG